ncbi:hypothetical protein BL253_32665 [Pseudofrankia asymbiotica]|uniref:Tetracyclin repressor-like C-terminal domain-containing protein n=1 Tax=Pseudofrankia asymbiotica TaxID=1834516 RepID=A0A1V2I1A7_9ACTN|nr:TetR-like C-terminal domain-containing protein [Pseudofrankia asymbiotica]ONH23548.1 hypothetical protein BL253_32665 [Pseudofrankia asymbiotica]
MASTPGAGRAGCPGGAAGIERGELDGRLDPDQAIDQLAGPLIYRRLLAGRTFGADYVRGLVGDFLRAHGPRP